MKIWEQKEVEKLIAEISRLHNELNDLVKENREREQRDNNIKKSLIKEIDKLKKEKLELIRQNNKLNKKISSYEKRNDLLKDIPSEEEIEKQYKEYYSSLENELYCE